MTPKVLLAEDDDGARLTLAHALRQEGYEVEEAVDGLVAAERGTAGDHALVILDIEMPGLDGLEVCRAGAGGAARGADHDAHGPRRRARRGPRPRRRRRRLRAQAVPLRRAAGAGARAAAPLRPGHAHRG